MSSIASRPSLARLTLRAVLAAVVGVIGLQVLTVDTALAGPVYQVVDADADPYDGIYLRNGAAMGNVTRDSWHYMTYGTSIEILCQVMDGEAVGPYQNRHWYTVRVASGPNAGHEGWLADRYTNTPVPANQPLSGVGTCGQSPPTPTPVPTGTRTNTSTPVRMCTNLNDTSCGTVWTLGSNTAVTMRCWFDESSYAGTVRWYWISGGGVAGFVSANQVSSPTTVGYCNNDPQIKAIRWAGSRLNENTYSGWCQAFVHDAYMYGGRDIAGAPTAKDYWYTNPRYYQRTSSTTPPAGYLAYWNGTPGYTEGHVALSIGNGWAISTSERANTVVHVMSIADRNRTKPYLGALNVT